MAGKPRDRRELRRQYDAAEPLDPMEQDDVEEVVEDADDEDAGEKKPKKKAKAPAKSKAKAAKPAARMRIVWAVMNDAFKQVGVFEYSQREAAEARAKELTEKGKGTHFVHKVKEPMPDDAPGLGAAIPRTPPPAAAAVAKETVAIEDDEDVEVEEEDAEVEEEEDEEE